MSESSRLSLNIFGSCVSRDVLNYDDEKSLRVNLYITRHSILSALAKPVPAGEITVDNPSAFQKQIVEQDINKTAFRRLRDHKSDYLMIDLIDERLRLMAVKGTLVTVSSEFLRSVPKDIISKGAFCRLNLKDGKLYLDHDCVEEQIQAFCARILEIYPPDRIILHKAKMVDAYIGKDGQTHEFVPEKTEGNHKFNALTDAIFQRMEEYFSGANNFQILPGGHHIHIIDEIYGIYASEDNRWGLAPMHYQTEYYLRVLKRLREIIIEGKE